MLFIEKSVSHVHERCGVEGFGDVTECQEQRQWNKTALPHHFPAPDFDKCTKRKSLLKRLSGVQTDRIKCMTFLLSVRSWQCWGWNWCCRHLFCTACSLWPPPCCAPVLSANSPVVLQPSSPPLPSGHSRCCSSQRGLSSPVSPHLSHGLLLPCSSPSLGVSTLSYNCIFHFWTWHWETLQNWW